jgi:hypothetical protein
MKYGNLLVAFWFTVAADSSAAGLADRFRDFIVGPVAQAAPSTRLDVIADKCLGCHDGNRGVRINARPSGSTAPGHDGRKGDHPLGMVYDDSVRRNPWQYRSSDSLRAENRLVDGRVSCVSCHRLRYETLASNGEVSAAPEGICIAENKAKARNRGALELCFDCHVK